MSDLDPTDNELAHFAPIDTNEPEIGLELPTSRSAWNETEDESHKPITIEARRKSTLEWSRHIIVPGEVTEVFVKNARGTGKHLSGFYDSEHLEALALHTVGTFFAPAAVYFRINPVNESLLRRAPNQLRSSMEVEPSRSENIVRRGRLMIDLDPIRSDKGCATNEEKHFAQEKLEGVLAFLNGLNWRPEATIDTGNGFCIYLKVDLPTDDQGMVKEFLATLGREFTDEHVCVDRSVHDVMRLGRLPGTLNCKGDNTEERPHRLCQLLSMAEDDDITVTRCQIERLIGDQCASSTDLHGVLREATKDQLLRAKAYVSKMLGAIEGQGGHNRTFDVACRLVIDFAIPAEQALPILREYNRRCRPQWTDSELRHKLLDAERKVASGEMVCGRLNDPKICSLESGSELVALEGAEFHGYIPDFGDAPYSEVFAIGDINLRFSTVHRLLRFLGWTKFHSDPVIPDILFRQLVWGGNWPRNWRRALSAIIGKTGERLGQEGLCTSEACLFHALHVRHEHYSPLIQSWGTLERFAEIAADNTFRWDQCDPDFVQYSDGTKARPPKRRFLPYDLRHRDELTRLRKGGDILPVYWPAYLLGASRKIHWTPRQLRTIIAVVREITRSNRPTVRKGDRFHIVDSAQVVTNGGGDKQIECPLLDINRNYVVFGGNGRRSGRGYQIFGRTLRGWLRKIGYTEAVQKCREQRVQLLKGFLGDLTHLAGDLDLIVAGYQPQDRRSAWKNLEQLVECTRSRYGVEWLENCSLRIFTFSDWLLRWRYFFSRELGFRWIPKSVDDTGPWPSARTVCNSPPTAELVRQVMRKHSMNRSRLSFALTEVMQRPVSRQRVSNLLIGLQEDQEIHSWLKEFLALEIVDATTSRL
jgi:hypothetical protein